MTTSVINLKGHIHDYGPRLQHRPAGLVYVGRRMTMGGWHLPAHPLANPFSVKALGGREEAVAAYCRHLLEEPGLLSRVPLLRGSTLACWCAPEACHADVLARLADAERADYRSLLESWAAVSGRAERDAEAAQAWQRRVSGE